MEKKNFLRKKYLLILVFILLLGSALRLYDLGEESFWYDELFWIEQLEQPDLGSALKEAINYNMDPPIYQTFFYFWLKLGKSEFWTRLPSAFFGILSIYFIFVLASYIYNKKVGLIAAFILSISRINIYYSQEARVYSFFVFMVIISYYLFLLAIDNRQRKQYIFYLLSLIVLLHTHYYGVFVVFSQLLYLIWSYRRKLRFLKKFLLAYLASFASFIPWLIVYFNSTPMVEGLTHGRISMPKPSFFLFLLERFSPSNSELFPTSLLFNQSVSFSLGGALFLLLFLFGMVKIVKNKEQVLLFWFFIPLVVSYCFSLLFFPIINFLTARYLLFISIPFCILIANSIFKIKNKLRKMLTHFPSNRLYSIIYILLKISLVIFIVVVSINPLYSYYAEDIKTPWKDISLYIEENSHADDKIILNLPYYSENVFNHYFKKNLVMKEVEFEFILEEDERGYQDAKKALKLPDKLGKRVWVLSLRYSRQKDIVKEGMEKDYLLKEMIYHKDIVLFLFELR